MTISDMPKAIKNNRIKNYIFLMSGIFMPHDPLVCTVSDNLVTVLIDGGSATSKA